MKLGYNSNGLAGIAPVDAITALARIGYRGVALTLDRDFVNPFSAGLEKTLDEVKSCLIEHRLSVVVETGARYLLDSQIKHEPTLLSSSSAGRERRVAFLKRAVDVAVGLDAECVSLWSGAIRDGAEEREAFARLTTGLLEVLRYAAGKEIMIAFEPEPDMFIDTMRRYGDLLDELQQHDDELSFLRLTIDIGHLHCQAEVPIADYLRTWSNQIANIHIEDMRAGVHEHLMFGEGEIDFPAVIAALDDIGYTGLVNVELSRHAHLGLAAAEQSYEFLESLLSSRLRRRSP